MKHQTLGMLLFLCSPASGAMTAARQETQDESDGLRAARRTFEAADLDADGWIDATESGQALIPEAAVGDHDEDGDGRLSAAEFFGYYVELLGNSGREVARDLRGAAGLAAPQSRPERGRQAIHPRESGVALRLELAREALDRADRSGRRRGAPPGQARGPRLEKRGAPIGGGTVEDSTGMARMTTVERLRIARRALDEVEQARRLRDQRSGRRRDRTSGGVLAATGSAESVAEILERARRALDDSERRRARREADRAARREG